MRTYRNLSQCNQLPVESHFCTNKEFGIKGDSKFCIVLSLRKERKKWVLIKENNPTTSKHPFNFSRSVFIVFSCRKIQFTIITGGHIYFFFGEMTVDYLIYCVYLSLVCFTEGEGRTKDYPYNHIISSDKTSTSSKMSRCTTPWIILSPTEWNSFKRAVRVPFNKGRCMQEWTWNHYQTAFNR